MTPIVAAGRPDGNGNLMETAGANRPGGPAKSRARHVRGPIKGKG
jgi:hypothetical protein